MKRNLLRYITLFAATILIVIVLFAHGAPVSAQTTTVPLTVTITGIGQLADIDTCTPPFSLPSSGTSLGDWYAVVWLNGTNQTNYSDVESNDDCVNEIIYGGSGDNLSCELTPENDVCPKVEDKRWTFTQDVPVGPGTAAVSIELWDEDVECSEPRCDEHEQADLSGGDHTVDLEVDLSNGRWTGDVTWPKRCSHGSDAVLCWTISVISASGDADGDGLLDDWEINGYDHDGDGTIDVDLTSMGANPLHKDLFVELDAEGGNAATRAEIQKVKAAFAAAPLSSGSAASTVKNDEGFAGIDATPNPDGLPGINLWIDTGATADPTAAETGAGASSCGDGIDNDGNGLVDNVDPSCLVGDNFGGGELFTPVRPPGSNPLCGIDLPTDFYKIRSQRFNRGRRKIFRYGIEANQNPLPASSGLNCTRGGQGELGGNDFIVLKNQFVTSPADGGAIMHELGHNLNLRHGGGDDDNCKPNYVSVMNYFSSYGIYQNLGGTIYDYSPPRFAGGRGIAPLADLKENELDESVILDTTDSANQFVFSNGTGNIVWNPLNAQEDWNGDGDTADYPPNPTPVPININTSGTYTTTLGTVAIWAPSCATNMSNEETLNGFDDWSHISLPFWQFGDHVDGPINPVTEYEPTMEDHQQIERARYTTDLGISMADVPDPVTAGTQLTYSITVTDHGLNPASQVQVLITLPTELIYQNDTGGCVQAPVSTLRCNLGAIFARETNSFTITVLVPPDLVHKSGGPKTLTNTASVTSLVGPDPNPINNRVSEQTQVVAVADLDILRVEALSVPSEILIGEPVNITLHSILTNHGPSAPIDAALIKTANASSGSNAFPVASPTKARAIAREEQREVNDDFTIMCAEPGPHTFTLSNEIHPLHPDDTDPKASNNQKQVTFTVECVVPVAINVKHRRYPNRIYIVKGADIPIDVLTTWAGEYAHPFPFNATTIDPLSARVGLRNLVWLDLGGSAVLDGRKHIVDAFELDDKTQDGDADVRLHFRPLGTGLMLGDTEACVKGEWFGSDGNRFKFFGCTIVEVDP